MVLRVRDIDVRLQHTHTKKGIAEAPLPRPKTTQQAHTTAQAPRITPKIVGNHSPDTSTMSVRQE